MLLRGLVAHVLLVALVLTGSVAPAAATPGTAHVSRAGAVGVCPPNYPWPLAVRAETPDELEYLGQIDACTNAQGSYLWLRNRSDMVWIPSVIGGGSVHFMSPVAKSFTAAIGYPSAALVPGDDVVVAASPERVSWKFNIGMSAAWEARGFLWDWALSTGLAAAFNNRNLRVGSSVATCLLAVKDAVDLNQTRIASGVVGASSYVSSVLNTGLGVTKCAQGLRQSALDYKVRIPNYARDLTFPELVRVKQVDSLMTKMLRAQRWSKLVLLLFG